MHIFETILVLFFGAALLSMVARRLNVPYPTLLALGGVVVALIPGTPMLDLPPELILALFVAPVLLDAAHDTSLRDLRENWRPVLSLVLVAVGLTTVTVALVAKFFLPEMPWGAAIALGALLAPPDAVAALAVLRQVSPPHRIRTILEGESLLNDASSLLIYKLAIGAVAAGSFSVAGAMPAFALVTFGSTAAGWAMAKIVVRVLAPITDAPTATIIQFVTTFGVWIVAERLGLSGVITIVVFGLTAARRPTSSANSHVRVLSNSTWEAVTFVLNVLAFTLIGLQVRPIIEAFPDRVRWHLLGIAAAILGVVVVVRLAWVLVYGFARDQTRSERTDWVQNAKSRLMVGWAGMRGIVTLAAALALPVGFPYRDFILLTAFTVVLGTLVVQGLTLRPLLLWLNFPIDNKVQEELATARGAALEAAMAELDRHEGAAAERMKLEYREALSEARVGRDPRGSSDNSLRQQVVPASRRAIDGLRDSGRIGDDAYRAVERELDLLELSSRISADTD
ncbi:cation:proton antiporter [Cupriavidus sp. CuC1]|uniref:cation:proton antiporter n=1 Tax=Cupriavidus sp. CuC1 TaxID=3373131 RepID=UPI0037D00084